MRLHMRPDHLHNLKFRKLRSLENGVGLLRSRSPPVPRLGHSIAWCCCVNLNKSQTAFDFIRSHTDRQTIDLHLRSTHIQRKGLWKVFTEYGTRVRVTLSGIWTDRHSMNLLRLFFFCTTNAKEMTKGHRGSGKAQPCTTFSKSESIVGVTS